MKPILISIIVLVMVLKGISDALKDDNRIEGSKIIEVIYITILFLLPNYFEYKLFNYLLCLGLLHLVCVNVSYGITRKGLKWWFIGSTSRPDRFINWLINEKLKAPQPQVLGSVYLLFFLYAIFELYRTAIL